ncbi:MAG: cation diffusion facilitator family transporter [Lactobacillales bacterium]|jgi:cobalt-zinc-cadmium efflux system protein|nr:cation diffusion facilitator family transporter [Lactobacillales bacterium]
MAKKHKKNLHKNGHSHDHSHAPQLTASNQKVVFIGFLLTTSFMFVEFIGGLISGSLALIADSGHMLIDSLALLLAFLAFHFGKKPADAQKTYGYMRLEVLAGFVNAVTLIVLVGFIFYEAILRFFHPVEIMAPPMFIVAVAGLCINIGVFYILSRGEKDHVNIRGAMLHVLGDLLGSIGVIIAAAVIYFTGWKYIDPIISVVVSLFILNAVWRLLKKSLNILMESVPEEIDIAQIKKQLPERVPGLTGVCHIHVWSLTSKKNVATLVVNLKRGTDPFKSIQRVKHELEHFHITHSTVEVRQGKTDCSLFPDIKKASKGKK